MLNKLKLKDITSFLNKKRIFIRTDFNVPINNSEVSNDFRIKSSLPSIDLILENNPQSLIVASHLGRPNGKVKKEFSMEPVFKYLKNIYQENIIFVDSLLCPKTVEQINQEKGKIILLQNLRYHPEEEGKYKNDQGEKQKCSKEEIQIFRSYLNQICDIYVNDAFGTMHRAHSSIVGIEKKLKASGLLVEQELNYFGHFLEKRTPKTTIVLGGAKVEDKIPIIKNLINLCDDLIIGGGMAFTFLKAMNNFNVGKSILEENQISNVQEILKMAKQQNVKIHLPIDIVCANEMKDNVETQIFTIDQGIPNDMGGFDIGPQSIRKFNQVLEQSQVILMNGLMGVFEINQFQSGSREIIQKIAQKSQQGSTSILGGGDTTSCVSKLNLKEKMSHVSTGGGASLELLGGIKLPGITHLSEKTVLDN